MSHNDPDTVALLREKIMDIDFSWETVIGRYVNIYRRLGATIAFNPATTQSETPIRPNPEDGTGTAAAKPPKKIKPQNQTADTKTGAPIAQPDEKAEAPRTETAPPPAPEPDQKIPAGKTSGKKLVTQKPADTESAERKAVPSAKTAAPANNDPKEKEKPAKPSNKPPAKQQAADTKSGVSVVPKKKAVQPENKKTTNKNKKG